MSVFNKLFYVTYLDMIQTKGFLDHTGVFSDPSIIRMTSQEQQSTVKTTSCVKPEVASS